MAYRRKTFRKRPSTRLKKRWTLSAQVGKNVPIIGGTGLRLSSRSLKNVVTQVMNKTGESKIYIYNAYKDITDANPAHNTIYTHAPLQSMALGTGERNRIGDSIFCKFIKLRYSFQANQTLSTTKLRVIVIRSDRQSPTPPNRFGSAFGLNDLFYADNDGNYPVETIRGLLNLKDANINAVLYDKVHTCSYQGPQLGANSVAGKTFDVTIPVNKKLTYDTSGYQKGDQYYVITIPWIGGGATGTTLMPYVECQSMVTYLDN